MALDSPLYLALEPATNKLLYSLISLIPFGILLFPISLFIKKCGSLCLDINISGC